MSICRDGKDAYILPDRLPFGFAFPASWSGRLARLQRDTFTVLVPDDLSPLTVAGSLAAGEVRIYRFYYGDATFQQRVGFSMASDMASGNATFPAIVDIMEDRDEEVVLVHPSQPRKIATSYVPARLDANDGFAGTPQAGHLGTALYGFNPQDYGQGVDFYRVRVRGIPSPHPWFKFRVGQGGDFTLGYWLHQAKFESRIHIWLAEPAVGEEVFFRAEVLGGGSPTIFQWDFGDLGVDTGQQVSHTYGTVGQFKIKLTVSDAPAPIVPFVTSRLLTVSNEDVRTRRTFGLAKSP